MQREGGRRSRPKPKAKKTRQGRPKPRISHQGRARPPKKDSNAVQDYESFTLKHFAAYSRLLIYDDEEQHEPEEWELAVAEDIFAGASETWAVMPEGNGKSTFISQLCLYGADYAKDPWIPVGASSAQQAKIVYSQAEGFVNRTPGMKSRFRCLGGYKVIRSKRNGGQGIQIYAHDDKTGDGVIPYPFVVLDELHRHPDLRLYRLWHGKTRKRGAQLLASSTAGEPYSPFEVQRDQIRDKATNRKREGSHLRASGGGLVLHEWMVESDEACKDMEAVKKANPLSTITVGELQGLYDSPTRDDGDWKRLKCNRPARSSDSAITEQEWDEAEVEIEFWNAIKDISIGLDVGWKWDTTGVVPLGKQDQIKCWGPSKIIVPPRDGSLLHPDEIKNAIIDIADTKTLTSVVMDISRAQDIASWIEDETGVPVVEWGTSNQYAVEDFDAVMEGLRNGTLKHVNDPDLRHHAMNAISRRLPGGDHRFDRPNQSRSSNIEADRRVIDGLTAAGMVLSVSNREVKTRSVYSDNELAVA